MVPEKKAKKEATGTRKSSRFQVSDDSEADSSHEDEEEKKKASPPAGGGKKRKASPTKEAEGSKKGRTLPQDCSAHAGDETRIGLQGPSPWRDRKYPDSRMTS